MKIIKIDDINTAGLEIFTELSERQLATVYEPEPGLFIAESEKITERALGAGYEPVRLLCEEGFLKKADEGGIVSRIIEKYPETEIYSAELSILKKLTGYNLTGGILCAMRRKKPDSPADVLKKIEDGKKKRIVIIDNVENPTNIGAIFRSAAALGMDAVLVSADSSDPLYRRAARVSMGTVFQIPWTYMDCEWPGEGIGKLHACGYKLVSMALKEDSLRIDDKRLADEEKLAILMGNEGDGLKQETIDASDYTVMIPMYHGVDSLNVAAASAVAFYALKN